MIDNLTPEDRALCEALDAFVETHTEIVGNIEDAATRIIELSRRVGEMAMQAMADEQQLLDALDRAKAAEADAARLAEALGVIADLTKRRQLPLTHEINDRATEALAAHTARLIDG